MLFVKKKCLLELYFNMEEWKDIQGFEGLYQVSNQGRVKTLDRYLTASYGSKQFRKGQIIKGVIMPNGYVAVGLWKNNKSKSQYIHRLVAKAFIANPNSFKEVNHKDEDKTNNCVSNLEWCDHLYNINYGTAKERISKSNLALQKGTKVAQYKGDKLIAIFANSIEASRKTGVDSSAIRKVCLGRKKFNTAGGYIWRDF